MIAFGALITKYALVFGETWLQATELSAGKESVRELQRLFLAILDNYSLDLRVELLESTLCL